MARCLPSGWAVVLLALLVCLGWPVTSAKAQDRDWPQTHTLPEVEPDREAIQEAYVREQVGLQLRVEGDEITVTGVAPDSPAARAGFQPGDVLAGWRSPRRPERIHAFPHIGRIGAIISAGVRMLRDWTDIEIVRAGKRQVLRLPLEGLVEIAYYPGQNDAYEHAYSAVSWEMFTGMVGLARCLLGIHTDDRPQENNFAKGRPVIAEVLPDGPAARAGLQAGDTLIRWTNIYVEHDAFLQSDIAFIDGWRTGLGERLGALVSSTTLGADEWAPSWVAPEGWSIGVHYLREGEEREAVLALADSLPLKTELERQGAGPPFDLAPGDFDQEVSPAIKLAVATYLLLERQSEEGLSEEEGLKVRDELLATCRAVADQPAADADDRLMALRLVYLLQVALEEDWAATLERFLREFAAAKGAEALAGFVASDLLGRTSPPDRPWRLQAKTPAALGSGEGLVGRAAQHVNSVAQVQDVLQAVEFLHQTDEVMNQCIQYLRHTDTNATREQQLEWMAAYQVSLVVRRHSTEGQPIPSNTMIEYHDAERNEAQPLEAQIVALAMRVTRELLGEGGVARLEPAAWAACAYLASRGPLTTGGVTEIAFAAGGYLGLFPEGEHAAAALGTRAAFLQSRLPQAEREELKRLALAEEDVLRRDAMLFLLFWTIPHEQAEAREEVRSLMTSRWLKLRTAPDE